MTQLENLKADLKKHASPEKAKILQRFFKTGNQSGIHHATPMDPKTSPLGELRQDIRTYGFRALLAEHYLRDHR